MARWTHLLLSTVVAAALAAAPAVAEETTVESSTAEPSIPELIEQLEAEEYTDRQAASDQLAKRGKDALPALSKAAESESAEASSRALEILRKHFESSDGELQRAAKETLQKLSASEHAVAARRAEEMLKSKKPAAADRSPLPLGVAGPIIVPGGLIPARDAIELRAKALELRMRAMEGGPGVRRISVRSVDGVKETQVQHGERKIDISEDPAKGIKMKVTEKVDGKDEIKEYEAKDVDELKTKHPEAHKLFEQYSQKMGGVRIEGFGGAEFRPFGEAVPAMPGIAPRVPIARRMPVVVHEAGVMIEQLEKSQEQLVEATRQLEKLATADDKEAVKKALEAVEAARKTLEEVRAKLPTLPK